MQNVHNEKNRLKKTVSVSILILSFFFMAKEHFFHWFQSFSHAKNPIIYLSVFCLTSFLFLVIFRSSNLRIRIKSIIVLVIVGHVISMLSLLLTERIEDIHNLHPLLKNIQWEGAGLLSSEKCDPGFQTACYLYSIGPEAVKIILKTTIGALIFFFILGYWSFFLGGWLLVPLCDILASLLARIKLKRQFI